MRLDYDEQLQAFDQGMLELTDLVRAAMADATTALLDAHLELAEAVIAGDAVLDASAAALEDQALQVIALQAPVATDLRVLLSGLKIASSLERMGDLAEHVAKAARLRYPGFAMPGEVQQVVREMGTVADRIVLTTADVLRNRDVEAAERLALMDDQMDQLHRQLFRLVLSPEWSFGVEAAIDVTLVSRYYERFADHAVSIGRRVIHIVTGEPYGPA